MPCASRFGCGGHGRCTVTAPDRTRTAQPRRCNRWLDEALLCLETTQAQSGLSAAENRSSEVDRQLAVAASARVRLPRVDCPRALVAVLTVVTCAAGKLSRQRREFTRLAV